jgi:hypothetical protein
MKSAVALVVVTRYTRGLTIREDNKWAVSNEASVRSFFGKVL